MTSDTYSPWRNSIVMLPSGKVFGDAYKARPASISIPRPALVSAEMLPPDRDYLESLLKDSLQTIDIPSEDSEQEDVHIADCTYIGSYNWVKEDTGTPTILVPGSPPQWQNRQLPYTIPPDRGVYCNDENGYKMPKAVLLPLIVAVNKRFEMSCKSPFAWSSVDIVTDRDNLTKLLGWSEGATRDFRIDLQLAGDKTILMNRWSERYSELFSARTYAFSFGKDSTVLAPGCKNTTRHNRIVTYDLNGLKMVVRFEVDACIRPAAKYPRRSMSAIEELTQSMATNSLSSQTAFRSEYPLLVREGGSEVSAAAVIELVVRSQASISSKAYDWNEGYPPLFFGQTTQHYLAVHKHGRFAAIEKRKLASEELQEVGKSVKGGLKKVRKVLDVIRELVIGKGKEGRLSLVCKDGILSVYERKDEESLLPIVAMKYFES